VTAKHIAEKLAKADLNIPEQDVMLAEALKVKAYDRKRTKKDRTDNAKKLEEMVELIENKVKEKQESDCKQENKSIPEDSNISNKSNNKQTNVLSVLKDLQIKDKNNDLITQCIKVCEEKIKVNQKKEEKKNIKINEQCY
jgi:hypothetical protein